MNIYRIILLISLMSLLGCGAKVETKTQDQIVKHEGEGTSIILVRLEFIEQIRQLCEDKNIQDSFTSEVLWKQAIAECTFDNLSLVSIDPVQALDFTNDYCTDDADLSGFSPEEQASILAACEALGN